MKHHESISVMLQLVKIAIVKNGSGYYLNALRNFAPIAL